MTESLMPAAFVGHGSPMNTLTPNRFTDAWRDLGRRLPRPDAVLCVSAHWYINATAVTAMAHPRVIHDFHGFPEELSAFDYPAAGSPELAEELAELLAPWPVSLDRGTWGLDHGAWSVLAHLFPKADIPVVQLSLDGSQAAAHHVAIGRALAPLRERSVFILCSGNVVHNLRLMSPSQPESTFDWAERFDTAVQQLMATDPGGLPAACLHSDYALSAPTPEHFLPLCYLAGLSDEACEPAQIFVEGGVMGSLTMTGFTLGLK